MASPLLATLLDALFRQLDHLLRLFWRFRWDEAFRLAAVAGVAAALLVGFSACIVRRWFFRKETGSVLDDTR